MKRVLVPLFCAALFGALLVGRPPSGDQAAEISAQHPLATGRQAASTGGAAADKLVFTPLPPCRVFDTRLHPQGKLVHGAQRLFDVATDAGNPDLSSQGGNSSGCGVPYGTATAVLIALTAIPDGTGFLRAWAAGQPEVGSTSLNYSTALNATNTTSVPLCDPGNDGSSCGTGDVVLKAFGAATHVVGDVTGYFSYLPLRPEVGSLKVTSAHASTGTCSKVGGADITLTPGYEGDIVVEGDATVSIDHTVSTADEIRLYVGYGVSNGSQSVVNGCSTSGSACDTSSVAMVPAADATVNDVLMTVPVRCTIPVSLDSPDFAGETFTISMWVRNLSGAGSDEVTQARLDAVFLPDQTT